MKEYWRNPGATAETLRADIGKYRQTKRNRQAGRKRPSAPSSSGQHAKEPNAKVQVKANYPRRVNVILVPPQGSLSVPGLTLMPHIARQIQSDVVVSVTERRIDEHLGQWPAQASREEIGIETIQVGSDNIRIGLGRKRRPK